MKKFLATWFFVLPLMHFLRANGPVAHNDTVSVPENGPVVPHSYVTISILSSVNDPTGGQLTVSLPMQSTPVHGSILINGSNQVLYYPDTLYYGSDSFIYSACDTFHLCDTAKVYVNILGSNLPPVANSQIFTLNDTITAEFLAVLANDSDPNHDTIFITAITPAGNTSPLGVMSVDSANGLVLFAHTPYACGAENFKYTLCNYSLCDSAQITVIINCPANVSLPQGFSPNGDGKNDFLVFTGLEYFQPASLTVFNRYGSTVYQSSDYQNNWDGTDLDTHQPLPDGTYYYILQLPNGPSYNNYVIINR